MKIPLSIEVFDLVRMNVRESESLSKWRVYLSAGQICIERNKGGTYGTSSVITIQDVRGGGKVKIAYEKVYTESGENIESIILDNALTASIWISNRINKTQDKE